MYFEIIGEISDIEIIAKGSRVRRRSLLNERYGNGRWRKLKDIVTVHLDNGRIRQVEIHWYEANGIGHRLLKIKRYLE